eukprot:1445872-Prymnesium_polylepis.1
MYEPPHVCSPHWKAPAATLPHDQPLAPLASKALISTSNRPASRTKSKMRAASLCALTQPRLGVNMAGHHTDPYGTSGRADRSVTARESHLHGTRRHSRGTVQRTRR